MPVPWILTGYISCWSQGLLNHKYFSSAGLIIYKWLPVSWMCPYLWCLNLLIFTWKVTRSKLCLSLASQVQTPRVYSSPAVVLLTKPTVFEVEHVFRWLSWSHTELLVLMKAQRCSSGGLLMWCLCGCVFVSKHYKILWQQLWFFLNSTLFV